MRITLDREEMCVKVIKFMIPYTLYDISFYFKNQGIELRIYFDAKLIEWNRMNSEWRCLYAFNYEFNWLRQ